MEAEIRVFIAEDNPTLLQGLERALSASGYRVQTAEDGAAMLDLLAAATRPPDVLVSDVMMPRMSGIELARAVQEHPKLAGVPVLLITAAADEAFPGSLAESGAVDVLVKPFRLDELVSRIEKHVGPRDEAGAGGPTAPASILAS